jgi:hypothetical protein
MSQVICTTQVMSSLCGWDSRGRRASRALNEGLSIIKVQAIYETVKSFSYAHNISEHDKHNVLELRIGTVLAVT